MDRTEIINDLLQKAQQGDLLAQKQLAMTFVQNPNILDQGIFWLQTAAQTDADAMYALGRVILKKKNNPPQAIYWYDRAAQNGHPDAMIDMGAVYLFGFHVQRSVENAVYWYRKAAEKNNPVAYHNLGFLCLQDQQTHDTAFRFFRKAADLGYADAAYMLGILFLQGIGVEKNVELALENLTNSFELGKDYAARPIGDLYFQGVFDHGTQNPKMAIRWYERGAEKQVLSCLEVLGDCYYHGFGVANDLYRAYDYYRMAELQGSADAPLTLGFMHIRGEGVGKNLRQALKWMQIAQQRGNPKAAEYVKSLTDILGGPGTAAGTAAQGGASGIHLNRSYSTCGEAEIREKERLEEEKRRRNASIYAAAGALSGDGAYTDYEMGAVISADGEVSYVDADMGIIIGPDGAVSSHDAKTGLTYNWSTGQMLAYDEMFGATMDLKSGRLSYFHNGFTNQ